MDWADTLEVSELPVAPDNSWITCAHDHEVGTGHDHLSDIVEPSLPSAYSALFGLGKVGDNVDVSDQEFAYLPNVEVVDTVSIYSVSRSRVTSTVSMHAKLSESGDEFQTAVELAEGLAQLFYTEVAGRNYGSISAAGGSVVAMTQYNSIKRTKVNFELS